MNKPMEFVAHPVSFESAMRQGLFRGVVKRIHDGDTFTVLTDLGFGVFNCPDLRITDAQGFNTYEVVGVEKVKGLAAKADAETLALGKPVVFSTLLNQAGNLTISFDRIVADVWVCTDATTWTNVAQSLRGRGHDKLHPGNV